MGDDRWRLFDMKQWDSFGFWDYGRNIDELLCEDRWRGEEDVVLVYGMGYCRKWFEYRLRVKMVEGNSRKGGCWRFRISKGRDVGI